MSDEPESLEEQFRQTIGYRAASTDAEKRIANLERVVKTLRACEWSMRNARQCTNAEQLWRWWTEPIGNSFRDKVLHDSITAALAAAFTEKSK